MSPQSTLHLISSTPLLPLWRLPDSSWRPSLRWGLRHHYIIGIHTLWAWSQEGTAEMAKKMQDLALAEGALPRHLHTSLFTSSNDNRLLTHRSEVNSWPHPLLPLSLVVQPEPIWDSVILMPVFSCVVCLESESIASKGSYWCWLVVVRSFTYMRQYMGYPCGEAHFNFTDSCVLSHWECIHIEWEEGVGGVVFANVGKWWEEQKEEGVKSVWCISISLSLCRQLSRHLVGLWVTGNPTANALLHRVLVLHLFSSLSQSLFSLVYSSSLSSLVPISVTQSVTV